MEGGYWKVDGSFNPILRLKNVLLKQSLTVTPTLYFADGTGYQLPMVALEPAGVAQINIRNALQSVPANLQSHLSTYGMAGISYQWSWPAVIATIQSTDDVASLTITNSLNADVRQVHASPEAESAQVTRGTWWLPTANADGYLVLENPSLSAKQADVQFSGQAGNALAAQHVSLPSHTTTLIRFSTAFGGVRGTEKAGGISVQYAGPDHGLLAYAGIEDSVVGYSASPVMIEDHLDPARPVHQVSLSAPGLLLGQADPEMLFPSGTYFEPYAVLQNVSGHALQAKMTLVSQDESGTPRTQSLGQISLQPGETAQFDFESRFGGANPLPDGYGHLTASFQGQDGDLILETGSVDQTKNYVFEVAPSQQADSASRTICFWSVEGNNDSMITIWNYKDAAQDLDLTLYYSGGHYLIPIHLEALEAYNLDMAMLIRSQASDPSGALIPDNITSGSAFLSSPGDELEKISVAVSASVYSVRNATCGHICNTCNGVTSLIYQPGSLQVPILGTVQGNVQLTMNTGSVTNNPSGGIWSTSNPAVAKVNSTGVHTGVSVGSTTSTFTLTNAPVNAGTICAQQLVPCPFGGLMANAPTGVNPEVFQIQPAYLLLGTSGVITVNGAGFSGGTVSISAAGSMGGGISLGTPNVQNDNLITIGYQVPCGTPINATYPFVLTVDNGDGGGFPAFPLMLVVGLPLVPTPTIQFNGGSMSGAASVVVGQQIALTGTQSLPACMNLQSQMWTPPTPSGTPVGGYANAAGTGPPDTTGGRVLGLPPANGTNYTFYWTTQGNSLSTTYQYQMSATDINGVTVTSNMSPPATASFNVTGPSGGTMSFALFSPGVSIANLAACTTSTPVMPAGPYLIYAQGAVGGACPGAMRMAAFGITFNSPTGYQNASGGTFSLLQLISSDVVTGGASSNYGAGLDTADPFGYPPSLLSKTGYFSGKSGIKARLRQSDRLGLRELTVRGGHSLVHSMQHFLPSFEVDSTCHLRWRSMRA